MNRPVGAPVPSDAARAAIVAQPGQGDPNAFQLGLVLGGTVSAGAWTAGALDLLVQALDAFYGQPGGPQHKVQLRLAAGSSGGAVCAAILGMALNRPFVHAVGGQPALNAEGAGPLNNPFWLLWVNLLHFAPMLAPTDISAPIQDPASPDGTTPPVQHVRSLLNASVIDDAVGSLVNYANQPAANFIKRDWASQPFRVATTVCNLRGLPYAITNAPSIGGFSGSDFVQHDDFAWFAIPNQPDGGDGDTTQKLANEFWLSHTPGGITTGYDTLGAFARASGSMPVGLPGRLLTQPATHYLYRPVARVDDTGSVVTDWPEPDWLQLTEVIAGNPYQLTAVDGGTLNNSPVAIAHEALAGYGLHNPQGAAAANRALLLIDPLVDQPTPGQVPVVGESLLATLKRIIPTFTGGARYLTADIALFQDKDVFSRFQLVPSRTGFDGGAVPGDLAPPGDGGLPRVAEAALAGSNFSALAGWCAREYRVHDFLLGRMNMATYLRRELILRGDNALFTGWTVDMIRAYALTETGDRDPAPAPANKASYFLPVIPLPDDNFDVFLPQWPVGSLDPASLKDPIARRTEAVLGALREDNFKGLLGELAQLVALDAIAGAIAQYLVQGLSDELTSAGLWQPPTPAAAT